MARTFLQTKTGKENLALVVQRRWRGNEGRSEFLMLNEARADATRYEFRLKVALVLQAAFRARQGRSEHGMLKTARFAREDDERRQRCVLRVQVAWRSYIARKKNGKFKPVTEASAAAAFMGKE